MNNNTDERSTARGSITETGLFNTESLFVSFDFTRDALLAANERFQEALRSERPVTMPEEIKTYLHELTHYIQYTTTPYGLFLQYCRMMQSRATIVIVRALLDAGVEIRMPLLENVPILTGETEKTVQSYLSLWLNVDNLVAMLHGDSARRLALADSFIADGERVAAGQRPQLLPLFDLRDTFVRVQESMADLLEQLNTDARAAGNPVPMDPEGFDREALRQEKENFPSDLNGADLLTEFALEILGNPWNVEAIIESMAKVAESWGSDTDYDRFVAWANATVDPTLQVYRFCIAQGLSAIQTRRLPEFILSYMALCELTLYAPLLPHHAALRTQHPDLRQILPIHRWMELIGAASDIAPMRARSDHGRYVTDICRKLGWVHPIQIIKVAMDGPDMVSNPLAQIYLWAQQERARSSDAFLGVHRFLFDPSPKATVWRDRFNFVILDYADRTMYHRDKEFLQAMTTRHLNMLGMRCIMRGKSLTIVAPYRGDAVERSWMTAWLRDRFKAVFDRDFPMLQVV